MKTLLIIINISLSSFAYSQSFPSNFINDQNINNIKKHLEVLGSDLFEGRGTGTRGGELSANYIASIFRKYDLTPLGSDSSYYQNVPLHGSNFLYESKLYLYTSSDTIQLKIGKDYLLSNSGEQTYLPKPIDLISVGYGIIAPEFDHNDYLDKDVNDKIVIMFDGEPTSENAEFFNGEEPTIYSYPDVKHRVAISRGAAGTIIIPQINYNDSSSWQKLVNEYSFEDIRLAYNATNNFGIILNPNILRYILLDQKDYLRQNSNNKLRIKNCSLKFEGEFFVRDFISSNIIGVIEGNNTTDNEEYIIVSAHYDHLGIGPEINGDKIYNGVLDNAIGVSALLEIANSLRLQKDKLEKSIIFLAVTGEENGLLGSTFYVDHPIVPLYKTSANINIDGIAYLDEFKSIIGVGSELSQLHNYLENIAELRSLSIGKIPKEFYMNEAFNRSDQMSFAKAGIPSTLILDGPDYVNLNWDDALNKIIYYHENVYHTPFDDLSIKINYKAVKQHVDLIASFIYELAVMPDEINWNDNSPYNYIRLQTKAEKR